MWISGSSNVRRAHTTKFDGHNGAQDHRGCVGARFSLIRGRFEVEADRRCCACDMTELFRK